MTGPGRRAWPDVAFAPPDATVASTAERRPPAAAAASHHRRFKIFICCPPLPAGPGHARTSSRTSLSPWAWFDSDLDPGSTAGGQSTSSSSARFADHRPQPGRAAAPASRNRAIAGVIQHLRNDLMPGPRVACPSHLHKHRHRILITHKVVDRPAPSAAFTVAGASLTLDQQSAAVACPLACSPMRYAGSPTAGRFSIPMWSRGWWAASARPARSMS